MCLSTSFCDGPNTGFDELEGVNGVKMEGAHGAPYIGDGDLDQSEMFFDEDNEQVDYEASPELYNHINNSPGFETPHAPIRKLLPKGKINRQNNLNNNNNNNNATRQMTGVGHSLSLYRHQTPLRNFAPRNHLFVLFYLLFYFIYFY